MRQRLQKLKLKNNTGVDGSIAQAQQITLEAVRDRLPKPTLRRLKMIAKRIRSVIMTRSACVAWVMLAILTIAGILLDMFLVMSLGTRWLIAIMIFAAAFIAFCLTCFPRIRQLASLHWLAQVIETASPKMKHQLRSAIDLATGPLLVSTGNTFTGKSQCRVSPKLIPLGSPAFIDAFQMQVAGKIESVAPHHVVKWSAIRRWLLAAVALAALYLICFAIPSLSFAKRVGRVWLPSLNIGRITLYEVVIDPPASPWIEIRNDLFAVRARVTVGSPSIVFLELESDGKETQRIEMKAIENEANIFTQNIAFEGPRARIRAIAYDSASSWYDIELVDRPQVEPRSIVLHYPDYAKVPPLEIQDWNGDIDCVSGTQIKATFQSKTLLKSCDLLFESERKGIRKSDSNAIEMPSQVPMTVKSDLQQFAEFAVWSTGRYALKAVDDRTRKTSDTTRTYSVTSREDLPPKLQWIGLLPSRSRFIAANEIASLKVAFADEFPLEQAQVEYCIEGADWKVLNLATTESNSGFLEWSLDPLALNLKNSQLVEVRFVAVDRMKHRTVSEISQWLVNDHYTSADRWETLQKRFEVVQKLQVIANRWEDWTKESDLIWQKSPEHTLSHLRKIPNDHRTFEDLRVSILDVVGQSKDFAEQDSNIDLLLFLHRTTNDDLAHANLQIARMSDDASKDELIQARTHLREVICFARIHQSAYQLFGEDMLLAANQDMASILDAQRNLLNSFSTLSPMQIRDRQIAIGGLLENLLKKVVYYSQAFPESEQTSFNLQLRNLRQTHSIISSIANRSLLQNNAFWKTDESRRWVEQTLQQLEQYRRTHTMLDSYYGQHRDNRKMLSPQYAVWFVPLNLLQQLHENIALGSNTKVTLQKIVGAEQKAKFVSELLALARSVESQRENINRFYLSDIGNLRRALLNVTSDSFGDSPAKALALREITDAARYLATSHRMKLAIDSMQSLYFIEADSQSTDCKLRADQPRNFNDVSCLVEQARDQASQLQLSDAIQKAWQSALWSPTLQVIADSMNNRRWTTDPIRRVSSGQRELLDQLQQAKREFEPLVDEARRTIMKYVPRVSEVAAQAAKHVAETKDVLAKLKNVQNAKAIEEKQEQAEQAIDAVKQSLQDLAAVQDLLSEEDAQVAQDSDQAIQTIQAATQAAQELTKNATQQAAQDSANPNASTNGSEQIKEKAIHAQNALKDVLNQVSEHFGKIEQGDTPDGPFQSLIPEPKQKSKVPGKEDANPKPAAEQEGAYDEAKFLREMAALSPQEILNQLEGELPKREAMQESLESINAQNLEQSAATLASVAAKQRELTRELEMSDPIAQANLHNSVEQMQQLSRFLRKLSDQQINWALQTTGRAQLTDVQDAMNSTRSRLNQLANDLASANMESTLSELKEKLQSIQESNHELVDQFEQIANSIKERELKPISIDERQLKNLEREAKDWQSRYQRENENWLTGETRHRNNHLDQHRRQVENRERQLNEARQRLEKERQRFNKSKQETNDQLQLQSASQDVISAERELEAAKSKQQSAQAMADRAQKLKEIAEQSPQSELQIMNPHQGLARNFVGQTSDLLSGITSQLNELAKEVSSFESPQSRTESAKSASAKEQSLIKDVQRSESDLERASRHAKRLDKQKMADELSQLANQSKLVIEQNMQPAAATLGTASKEPSPQQLPAPRLDAAASKSAIDDLQQTQQSLNEMQNRLQKLASDWRAEIDQVQQVADSARSTASQTAVRSPSSAASGDGMSKSDSPAAATSFGDYLTEPEMARLLDDLDHLVFNSQERKKNQNQQPSTQGDQHGQGSSGQQTNASQSSSDASSKSSQGKQAMQSAADKLADMLAQQRAKSDNQSGSSQKGQQSSSQQSATGQSKSMSTSPAAGDVETPESSTAGVIEPVVNSLDSSANKNWASLRTSELENGTGQSKRGATSPYQTSIDAYFKALSKLRSTKP